MLGRAAALARAARAAAAATAQSTTRGASSAAKGGKRRPLPKAAAAEAAKASKAKEGAPKVDTSAQQQQQAAPVVPNAAAAEATTPAKASKTKAGAPTVDTSAQAAPVGASKDAQGIAPGTLLAAAAAGMAAVGATIYTPGGGRSSSGGGAGEQRQQEAAGKAQAQRSAAAPATVPAAPAAQAPAAKPTPKPKPASAVKPQMTARKPQMTARQKVEAEALLSVAAAKLAFADTRVVSERVAETAKLAEAVAITEAEATKEAEDKPEATTAVTEVEASKEAEAKPCEPEKERLDPAAAEAVKRLGQHGAAAIEAALTALEREHQAKLSEMEARIAAAKEHEQKTIHKAKGILGNQAARHHAQLEAAAAERRIVEEARAATTERLEALESAFMRRTEDVRRDRRAHAVHAGVHALNAALERGAAVERELAALDVAAAAPYKDNAPDPVVVVAARSLPAEALRAGVPTREDLSQRFEAVAGAARRAAAVPALTGGGPLAYGLAGLAAWLKVDEDVDTSGPVGVRPRPEQVVARARAALRSGDLARAARLFEDGFAGTAGAADAAQWAADARARAVAEQALAFMRAHAATLACVKQH